MTNTWVNYGKKKKTSKKNENIEPTEFQIHRDCVKWLDEKYNITPDGTPLVRTCSAGELGSAGNRTIRKKMGYRCGIPDFVIYNRSPNDQTKRSLFIEFKRNKYCKPSIDQVQCIQDLKLCNFQVEVIWNIEDFKKVVDDYFRLPIIQEPIDMEIC